MAFKGWKILLSGAFVGIVGFAGAAQATGPYMAAFQTAYPAAVGSRIDSCVLCHVDLAVNNDRNVYGIAYANAGHNFAAIESADSDLDTFTNLVEITQLFFPGDAADHPPVVLPTVTIAATDPTATEAGATTGQYTLTRTGDTTAALTVNYTVAGTATAGSDYASLAGSVQIPVGSLTATVTVTPIDDVAAEFNETVRATLSANAAYTVGAAASATVTIQSDDGVPLSAAKNDFDGDNRSDIGVYDPAGGHWYAFNSAEGFWEAQFGYRGTIPVTGDFDGDGRSDFGVYDPPAGMWYLFASTEGFSQTQFGFAGTIPVVGDFDGDGRSDIGVYFAQTGTWSIFRSAEGFMETRFGFDGTIPMAADYDGDGRCDLGVYFAPGGNWYFYKSTEGFSQTQFGFDGTIPVYGDFDGDLRDDFGVYDPQGGTWYLYLSMEGFVQTQFGFAGTEPVVGDFDGDGLDDISVYNAQSGTWYIFQSTEGFVQTLFGFEGTFPLGGTLR